jgi:hypothetical protein
VSAHRDFLDVGWSDDPEGLADLDRTRALCGAYVGPPCLPPDVEAEAIQAFREMAARLERAARTGWFGRKPAFAREAAIAYHRGLRSARRRQRAA